MDSATEKNAKDVPPVRQDHSLAARVMCYLSESFTSPVSLDELAARFFVTKYHLCRAFKAKYGISVVSFLRRKRTALAKAYLEEGIGAASAAERVGYGDYSTFFRAYKKEFGCAPTAITQKNETEKDL